MLKKLQTFVVLLIFFGGTFCTSKKFVNATNTPKHYFAVIMLLVILLFIAMIKKRVCIGGMFSSKKMLWGIIIICFIQACDGISQFIGWLQPNNPNFEVTGSFGNPVGFAAVLAMGFPIGLYLLKKSTKNERYLVIGSLITTLIAILLSGSRTGLLATLIASFNYIHFQKNIFNKFKNVRYKGLLIVLMIGLIIGGFFILYSQKKDSANGRILIWKVSLEMVKDKPLFGYGNGAFKAKYMDYQAEYFKNNPNSQYTQLADNVKHPFNEFIKVAVEFGLVGLVVILSIILFILWKIMKSKNEDRELVFSGLASFLFFACFSYPLQYVAVGLLLAFYLSLLLPSKEIVIKNTTISIFMRSVIVLACTYFVVHTFRLISAEMKWKTIAMSSLRGNTEEMLPEYAKLYSTSLKRNPFFQYNYGAELNVASRFDQSIKVLTECKKRFNDHDLQMLLADNYYKNGNPEKAIQIYEHASNMIPCRFLPLYNLFEIYKEANQKDRAEKFANKIINKKVKIPSSSVSFIKSEVKEYLLKMPKH